MRLGMTGLDLKFEIFQRTSISASVIQIPNITDSQTLGDAGIMDGYNIVVIIGDGNQYVQQQQRTSTL